MLRADLRAVLIPRWRNNDRKLSKAGFIICVRHMEEESFNLEDCQETKDIMVCVIVAMITNGSLCVGMASNHAVFEIFAGTLP